VKYLFIINTPAQAHTWKFVMKKLMQNGHDVKILARDYGGTTDLLNYFGFEFDAFAVKGSRFSRIPGALDHFQKCYTMSQKYSPSMIVGFGVDAAVTAKRFRKSCIVFMDDDNTYFQNKITELFASSIITPIKFAMNLGKKHIRVNSYKELAYLHPNYFEPDPSIYEELNLKPNERFIILRFNVWDAIHDIGKDGFSISDQFNLVKELEKYARVFISPEGKLDANLERYRLPIPLYKIHQALYYAHLLVTDTQTMATEAALLGTPVVRSNKFVGPKDAGNFIELEQKYRLIYSLRDSEEAKSKAIQLMRQPELKKQWLSKRQNLLADKIDLTEFLTDFIEKHEER
jgi:predicted glycosyltransferase